MGTRRVSPLAQMLDDDRDGSIPSARPAQTTPAEPAAPPAPVTPSTDLATYLARYTAMPAATGAVSRRPGWRQFNVYADGGVIDLAQQRARQQQVHLSDVVNALLVAWLQGRLPL